MATKWACLGPGKISEDFFRAISENLPSADHEFVAVASRDIQRAEAFAEKFKFKRAYGSYDEVAQNKDVEVVYIGTLHTTHAELSVKMLEAGKHVLCEKPMAMNYKQAKKVLDMAKANNLLFIEACWTRFTPAFEQIRKDLPKVGKVQAYHAVFNLQYTHIERIHKLELGGGVTLDIGIYTIQLACMIFKEMPESISAKAKLFDSGADKGVCVVMKYKGGGLATLSYSGDVYDSDIHGVIYGNKGTIQVHHPLQSPEKITTPTGEHVFPLKQGDYNFQNSAGLQYEAAAMREYILAGKVDNDIFSHADSEMVHQIMDEIRRQIGVVYPDFD